MEKGIQEDGTVLNSDCGENDDVTDVEKSEGGDTRDDGRRRRK